MVNNTGVFLILLAGVTQLIGCVGGSYCFERRYAYDASSSSSYYYYVQCTSGCCSSQNIYYCCDASKVGVIVGSTIGGIFFLGIIITAIVLCCVCKATPLCKNKNRVKGVVINLRTDDTNTLAAATSNDNTVSLKTTNQPPPPSSDLPNVPSEASPTLPPSNVLSND